MVSMPTRHNQLTQIENMKNKISKPFPTGLLSAACSAMLLGSASFGLAQSTATTNTFDIAGSTASFVNNWWGIGPTISWDDTRDAASDSASGSVRYEAAFTGAAAEQFMTHFTIANRWGWDQGTIIDATTYTNLSFDIKVDSSSAITPGGNYGYLEFGLTSYPALNTWNAMSTIGWNIPLSATGWTHHDIPINSTWSGIDTVVGFYIKMWSDGAHTNTLTFNVDNVMLTKPTAPVVIPPPTVSLKINTSGLNLVASSAGQYDRQQIKTVATSFGWIGAPEPITYEFTIKEGPGLGHNGFQAHLFLVPNSTDTASSIDWNTTNLFWMNVQGNGTTGAGEVSFHYKTNQPGGNTMLFNTDPSAIWTNTTTHESGPIGIGNLGTIISANILGTWKLTLNNDTNITVVASDGTTTNYTITADAATQFSGTVQAFFGAQPNDLLNLGLGYVFSKVKISNPSGTLIEDDFTGGTLDTVKWVKQASDAPGVFVVPTNSPLSVVWTLPAAGFYPQIGTNVASGSNWKSPLAENPVKIQSTMRQLLSSSELGSNNYFRMIKRPFVQLQVLMPGETNAPGTVTGKIGTPDPQTAGLPFNVTVSSVDSTWRRVSTADMVAITSSDTAAGLPADAALLGGTATFSVTLNTVGSVTVTASDVSDGTKTANTGTAITVN